MAWAEVLVCRNKPWNGRRTRFTLPPSSPARLFPGFQSAVAFSKRGSEPITVGTVLCRPRWFLGAYKMCHKEVRMYAAILVHGFVGGYRGQMVEGSSVIPSLLMRRFKDTIIQVITQAVMVHGRRRHTGKKRRTELKFQRVRGPNPDQNDGYTTKNESSVSTSRCLTMLHNIIFLGEFLRCCHHTE